MNKKVEQKIEQAMYNIFFKAMGKHVPEEYIAIITKINMKIFNFLQTATTSAVLILLFTWYLPQKMGTDKIIIILLCLILLQMRFGKTKIDYEE